MLPFEIQVEIIKRVPVKSLIQFRSVSKDWKSLIDSSKFITGYNIVNTHQLLVAGEEHREVKYVSFLDDDTFPQQKFSPTVPLSIQRIHCSRTVGSSNGLLCLYGYPREHHSYHESFRTHMSVVWNPSIRKAIAVIVPNVLFRPFESFIGFGVYPHTNDPRIIKITRICAMSEMNNISLIPNQVEVFRLSTGKWTAPISNRLPRKSIAFSVFQVVLGQFIYWFAIEGMNVDGGEFWNRNLIMSFDMETEEFREIDLPDILAKKCVFDFSISKIKESLAVVELTTSITETNPVCVVWMMEDGDPKAFTKLFTVNASIETILGFRRSGEPMIVAKDGSSSRYALFVYEPYTGQIKRLDFLAFLDPSFVNSYTESLLLLDQEDNFTYSV